MTRRQGRLTSCDDEEGETGQLRPRYDSPETRTHWLNEPSEHEILKPKKAAEWVGRDGREGGKERGKERALARAAGLAAAASRCTSLCPEPWG
jgi:hypothetical protein